jgi:hypothetical protein
MAAPREANTSQALKWGWGALWDTLRPWRRRHKHKQRGDDRTSTERFHPVAFHMELAHKVLYTCTSALRTRRFPHTTRHDEASDAPIGVQFALR